MFSRFYTHIAHQNYFSTTDRLLIAVSGGIDSMVLLHLMQQTDYKIGVAHFDHLTRDGESTKDLKFVQKYCERLNIVFHSYEMNKSFGFSNFQAEAHKQRYDFFHSLGYSKILTAHHKNDHSESIILNFLNGKSLNGINSKYKNIVRPMLGFLKSDIEKYATDNKLDYVEDSSNYKTDYDRNFIRNKILPTVKENFENIDSRIINLSQRINKREKAFNQLSEKFLSPTKKETHTSISKALISKLGNISTDVLLQYLNQFNFNHTQSKNILENLDSPGRIFTSSTHSLVVDRQDLRIYNTPEKLTNIEVSIKNNKSNTSYGRFNICIEKAEVTDLFSEKNIAYLDLDLLGETLFIRPWQEGDFFYPINMEGKKQSLKKYFNNEKIDRIEKDLIPILTTSRNEIIWVCGHRIDDRFKISTETKSVLKISLLSE